MIHDPLISAKLIFLKMLSHKFNASLQGFQTDSPMETFFADVLGGWCSCWLIQIDPPDENIKKFAADIDIGFAASINVKESNLNPNDPKVLAIKKRQEIS